MKVEVAENDARLGHPSRALTELNAIQKNYDLLAQREGLRSQWYNHLLRATQRICLSGKIALLWRFFGLSISNCNS